jgi:hypothetical protein
MRENDNIIKYVKKKINIINEKYSQLIHLEVDQQSIKYIDINADNMYYFEINDETKKFINLILYSIDMCNEILLGPSLKYYNEHYYDLVYAFQNFYSEIKFKYFFIIFVLKKKVSLDIINNIYLLLH